MKTKITRLKKFYSLISAGVNVESAIKQSLIVRKNGNLARPIIKSIPARIEKINDEKRLAFGWCSTVLDDLGNLVFDKALDAIDVDSMETAIYRFVIESRQGGNMHEKLGVATLVESVWLDDEKRKAMGLAPGKTGWWIGFFVHDDETWSAIKAGKLKEFSISGFAGEEEI